MYRFDRQRNEFAPVSKWWKKVSPAFFEHSRTHPSGKETWSSARWLVGPGGSMDGLAVRPCSGWQSKWSRGPGRTIHATSDLHRGPCSPHRRRFTSRGWRAHGLEIFIRDVKHTYVRACVTRTRCSYCVCIWYRQGTYVQVDVFDFKYTMQLNISPGIQSDTPHPRRRSM